ncbi:MAG: hypothetical protein ACI4GD_06740 [Lachnospiraceae bacterium]
MENDIGSLFSYLPCEDDDSYTIVLRNIVLDNNLIAREQEVERDVSNSHCSALCFRDLLVNHKKSGSFSKNSKAEKCCYSPLNALLP